MRLVSMLGLIGGVAGKYAWAVRGPSLRRYPFLTPLHCLMFMAWVALIDERTRDQCLDAKPYIAACYYGA